MEKLVDRRFYSEAARLTNVAREALGIFESSGGNGKAPFDAIRSAAEVFLDGSKLMSSVKEDIPLDKQYAFLQATLLMSRIGTLSAGRRDNAQYHNALNFIFSTCQDLEKQSESILIKTIFYSWQSQLPNNTNRGLIRDSLDLAVRHINASLEVDERVGVDSDTAETPGSPDIVNTILKKIDSSHIIVADLSLMKWGQPNCNVMFELGYAMKHLGDERIIMVFNDFYGTTRDLPFDLGFKRQLVYSCTQDGSKADVRKLLATRLQSAIQLMRRP